jgi:hypothetical protein
MRIYLAHKLRPVVLALGRMCYGGGRTGPWFPAYIASLQRAIKVEHVVSRLNIGLSRVSVRRTRNEQKNVSNNYCHRSNRIGGIDPSPRFRAGRPWDRSQRAHGCDEHEAARQGRGVKPREHTLQKVWTCSMHPQIKLPKPGSCPLCNMSLIPVSTQ